MLSDRLLWEYMPRCQARFESESGPPHFTTRGHRWGTTKEEIPGDEWPAGTRGERADVVIMREGGGDPPTTSAERIGARRRAGSRTSESVEAFRERVLAGEVDNAYSDSGSGTLSYRPCCSRDRRRGPGAAAKHAKGSRGPP